MIDLLPDHLRERARVLPNCSAREFNGLGSMVLYWMRSAVRVEENPALDAAICFAHKLDCPLLVYHAISEHYAFASERHHAFMLQGARDVQNQFRERGISYAFYLSSINERKPHLATLADDAVAVVTEDMPVDPPQRFVNSLATKTATSIVLVDTACVVPMQQVGKAYTRAFKFRTATKKQFAERLTRQWPTVSRRDVRNADIGALPFEPLDLQSGNLAGWLADCDIDHSIGPVVDTVGGSTAGYRRWDEFKRAKLSRYAKDRNDALKDGVSRMSAYLHYGMVSPFRIAREAAQYDHEGADKFLDELLIWRELAYSFCFYRGDHNTWSAIPDWARQTLLKHQTDQRDKTYSWEQLSRGETNDEFWNAAQQSLLIQGELHNNVRMTWGKAILNWKRDPKLALATIIDLNHRYALDGRDPASYGGILWCLGQFDRPFEPEKKIFGTVRQRPTSQHAKRLDVVAYRNKVATPRFGGRSSVAIIGAGMSGLFAGRTLQDQGLSVTVFEKSRGVGGRMSTRRVNIENHDFSFDHGAQYFTARDPRFIRYVESWLEQGIVARWPDSQRGTDQKVVVIEDGEIKSESTAVDRFAGFPAMNSICKHLSKDLSVKTQTRVGRVRSFGQQVELLDDSASSLGEFDHLIVSAPSGQAADLLVDFTELSNRFASIEMNPCWATMAIFSEPLCDQWVGAFLHNSFLSWAARNGTKPGRNDKGDSLVLHAAPDWTAEHWECDPEWVAQTMTAEFWRVTGIPPRPAIHQQAHRWKFAIADPAAGAGCFANQAGNIIACGDWANGSRVEGAFLSGSAAAGCILRTLSQAEEAITNL